MKYNSSQNEGDRRSGGGNRRGPRRNGGGNNRNNSESRGPRQRSNYGGRETPPPPKPTFWQKLVGFFTGKKSKPVAKTQTENRPERAPYRSGETRVNSERPSETNRPARKPELVEVTSAKLYVGNLSYEATESDLFDLFNGVGKVKNAEVVSNPYTQKSKGFAFVLMETVDEAKRAVVELHDKEFLGRKLVVSGSKTNDRPERSVRAEA